MNELIMDVVYTQQDFADYRNAVNTYLRIKKSPGIWLLYTAALISALAALSGMAYSVYYQVRYYHFAVLIAVPLLFGMYTARVKAYKKETERRMNKTADGSNTNVRLHITKDAIRMETQSVDYIYKKHWVTYLFLYNNNIALVCEQYNGILIPERYLDEQTKSVLYELYCDAEKISV